MIKGQHLRITLNGKYVAFSQSCTVHQTANLEESSTKDTTGDWTDQSATSKGWDISVNGLYSVATDNTGMNGIDLMDLIGQTVTVEFVQTDGEKNRVVQSAVKYSGSAIVNDVQVEAPNRADSTFSLQATGKGQLTKGTMSSSAI